MSTSKKTTKPGSLSQAFKAKAVADPDGALAFMLVSAFGANLATLMQVAERALTDGDVKLVLLAMTSAVQIRNHVVFVGADYGGVKTKYPDLIIEGQREQADSFNFGALHALGHILCHITSDPLGQKVLTKAGSCITGYGTTDSEAGKVNKEIANTWTQEDKLTWGTWAPDATNRWGPTLNPIVKSISARAQDFQKQLGGGVQPTGGAATSSRPAAKAPSPPTSSAPTASSTASGGT